MLNKIYYIAARRSAKFFRNGILLVPCTWTALIMGARYNDNTILWYRHPGGGILYSDESNAIFTRIGINGDESLSSPVYFNLGTFSIQILYHTIRVNVYDRFRNSYGNGLNQKLHFLGGDVSPTPPMRVKDILQISLFATTAVLDKFIGRSPNACNYTAYMSAILPYYLICV